MTNIGYQGKVKVSLLKGDTVINTTEIKNKGRWPLFYFIASAVSGTTLEGYRPKYIRVFNAGAAGEVPPTFSDDSPFGTGVIDLSYKAVMTSGDVRLNKEEFESSECYASMKFLVPYGQIKTSSSINMLALYCDYKRDEDSEPSAYCFITDANGKLKNLVDVTSIQSNVNDYNISIEWDLIISNK